MLTRKEVIQKAYHDCLAEMYEKSQPPGNYDQYLQDIKEGKINKDELVYERHYLSTEEMQYIVEKYIASYGMKKKWDSYLDLVITYLNDGGLKDKFIEAYTDNDGQYHTGYRSYETVQPIFEQFTNFIKMYNSEELAKLLSKKLTKLLNNTINNCKEFYNFDNEESQFSASVYLGPSPSTNKETVKEYWKKQGVEINIQDRNPLLFWEMDEYGDDFENVMEEEYGENWKKYWDKKSVEKKFLKDYFTIEALEDGLTVSFSNSGLEYSINNGLWYPLGSRVTAVNTGDKISFRGSNLTPSLISGIGKFTISKNCSVEGNIMSLLFGDDFEGKTDLTGYDYAFYGLFNGCTTLTDASNLILPATTLADSCYSSMFNGCASITEAPALPATTLADYCYRFMFHGCTSLTTAPALPATTLAYACYEYMFEYCTSLTEAPALPATTLTELCYYGMFEYCTSLTKAPELPATTLADYCYFAMFYGCSNLTVAPVLPATILASGCYSSMFKGCTGLTDAPELPATTLKEYCYGGMFYGCSSLTHITMLATDISASECLFYWVDGVAYNGTFVKHTDMTSLPSGVDGIPTGWTVEDA